MLPRNDPDRITVAFDDHRLVANAGLILPATLTRHLGLPQLVDRHLDLRDAPGQHRRQGDDPGGFRAGGRRLHRRRRGVAHRRDRPRARFHGQGSLHPPLSRGQALGTFLRSFRWGDVRQLDRVSRELLARAWAAGAGPGPGPLTIDLDSTICETYGLAREGRANTARGAADFLRETAGRVRHAGARGQLTVRADSGFYTHAVVAVTPRSRMPSETSSTASVSTISPRAVSPPTPPGWRAK